MTRRSLVLTSESARHPFRSSLPPHVFSGARVIARSQVSEMSDTRFFIIAFAAAFIGTFTFIL